MTFMYSLIKEQQRGRSPSGFGPDKTRSANLLNGFKNEPREAVRISLCNRSNTRKSVSSGYPNPEKCVEKRGRRPSF